MHSLEAVPEGAPEEVLALLKEAFDAVVHAP
jgi:hypothetical protein